MQREILSQEEIDALLTSLSLSRGVLDEELPEEQDGECQEYDFTRPTRFSKDALRSVHAIHDNYVRVMSSSLSSQLRIRARVEVVSVTQTTFEEFLRSTPVPTVMTQFKLGQDLGPALMGMEPSLALTIIVLALGGSPDTRSVSRDLTETEIAIMREFSTRLLSGLSYSWEGVAKVSPRIDTVHTNPHSAWIASPSEAVILVTILVDLGGNSGLASFCYPHPSIGGLLSALSRKLPIETNAQLASDGGGRFTIDDLSSVAVELLACMGVAELTVDEVMGLRPGCVLDLNRWEGEPIDVCVEGLPVFKGQPGALGGNLAVRFSTWVVTPDDQDQVG